MMGWTPLPWLCLLVLAAQPAVPTPRELWESFRTTLEPFAFRLTGDTVVPSATVPGVRLRRLDFSFSSQRVPCEVDGPGGKEWRQEPLWHDGAIYLPAGGKVPEARRGQVVIVGGLVEPFRESFLVNYGDAIAAGTGRPTMVLPNPGVTRGRPGEYPQAWLMAFRRRERALADHSHFRWAVPYLRGLEVMAAVLKVDPGEIRAVVGGHSKRATGAYTAAAIDPERIAGVVWMGNESLHPEGPENPWWGVSPYYTQRFVRAPVLYVGATNESGYAMFDINKLAAHMKEPWAFAMVPNYGHAAWSEQHFLAWRLWAAHVFAGRPLARIGEPRHEKTPRGTRLLARIDLPNPAILVQAWYVYCDDVPYWRDLVWYPTLMQRRADGLCEGFVPGRTPDAWLVEVQDTAQGTRGYVTSLPQDITGKPVARRAGQGMPRGWGEK